MIQIDAKRQRQGAWKADIFMAETSTARITFSVIAKITWFWSTTRRNSWVSLSIQGSNYRWLPTWNILEHENPTGTSCWSQISISPGFFSQKQHVKSRSIWDVNSLIYHLCWLKGDIIYICEYPIISIVLSGNIWDVMILRQGLLFCPIDTALFTRRASAKCRPPLPNMTLLQTKGRKELS